MSPLRTGEIWDVVVVGAGPAGALTAREAARRGLRVLLLDREAFPRWKVCGACLSPGAQYALGLAGLGGLPLGLGAVPLETLRLRAWGTAAELPLMGTLALTRGALDSGLVRAAREAGCFVVSPAKASWKGISHDLAHLRVENSEGREEVAARVVVAADGLRSGLMARSGLRDGLDDSGPSSGAGGEGEVKIGVGAVFPVGNEAYGPGAIHMVVGRQGYVGLVRTEDGGLNVAAAVRRSAVARAGRPSRVVGAILGEAGLPDLEGAPSSGWRGTPALGHEPVRVGGERILAVGDAAGFVEPFTGEGMSWAFSGSLALVPVLEEAVTRWHPGIPGIWAGIHRGIVVRSQRLSRVAAWTLSRSIPSRAFMALLRRAPNLARPFVALAATPPVRHSSQSRSAL